MIRNKIELTPLDFYQYAIDNKILPSYYVFNKNIYYLISVENEQLVFDEYYLPIRNDFYITNFDIKRDDLIKLLLPMVRREKIKKILNR